MSDDRGERADRLAARLVAASPYRIAPARSVADRKAIFRLRYETVVEMGWARPEELPEGVEHGDDDERASLVGAWDEDELVGTTRVVFPFGARRLPIVSDFGLELDSEGLVEVGRTVIVPRLRGDSSHVLAVALFAQSWLELRARGFNELISAVPRRLLEVYRSLGFTVVELGPPRQHWGELRFPVRFDVLGSLPDLERTVGVTAPGARR